MARGVLLPPPNAPRPAEWGEGLPRLSLSTLGDLPQHAASLPSSIPPSLGRNRDSANAHLELKVETSTSVVFCSHLFSLANSFSLARKGHLYCPEMPCFRGIDVSITAITELKKVYRLPEFPHPDGSIVRFRSPSPHKLGAVAFLDPQRKPPSPSSKSDSHNPETNVSVYVPSLPGTKLGYRYSLISPILQIVG
jgi:hypothetical protein